MVGSIRGRGRHERNRAPAARLAAPGRCRAAAAVRGLDVQRQRVGPFRPGARRRLPRARCGRALDRPLSGGRRWRHPSRAAAETASAAHWFGTDEMGDDILTRVIVGTRTSLWVGLTITGVASLIGVPLGIAAGY